ncbi:hypothetical protein FQR65_LT20893 [Abscondita terminalis]|nr:hypothetical protein FQR65_LT20893 [Abscondita terminalis]
MVLECGQGLPGGPQLAARAAAPALRLGANPGIVAEWPRIRLSRTFSQVKAARVDQDDDAREFVGARWRDTTIAVGRDKLPRQPETGAADGDIRTDRPASTFVVLEGPERNRLGRLWAQMASGDSPGLSHDPKKLVFSLSRAQVDARRLPANAADASSRRFGAMVSMSNPQGLDSAGSRQALLPASSKALASLAAARHRCRELTRPKRRGWTGRRAYCGLDDRRRGGIPACPIA